MLRQRTIVAILLVPAIVAILRLGGVIYVLVIMAALSVGAWEYSRMAFATGAQPPLANVLLGVWLLALSAAYADQSWLAPALGLFLIITTAWHALRYELGATTPLNDWAATLGGAIYLGSLGGLLIAVRSLPDGFWWTMTVLPAMWLSDTGAYVFGSWLGRHRMAPRLSPKKTWEGFVGGLIAGPLSGGLLAATWHLAAGPDSAVDWRHGAIIGCLVAVVGPIGDLGISMFKRQVDFKNTGNLLAGHGGILDRIDSWLVAGLVGFFYLKWFVIA